MVMPQLVFHYRETRIMAGQAELKPQPAELPFHKRRIRRWSGQYASGCAHMPDSD